MDDGDRKLEEYLETIRAQHKNWKTEEYPAFAPPGSPAESWRQCLQLAENYDKGMCNAYREQIDTLLVFAGLFSAILTAFTIESYQWLDNSAEDAAVQLLTKIAGSFSGNGTSIPAPPPPTSSLNGSLATRINIYWFLSLSLSLSAALVGILAKQWLREYETDVGRTPQEALAVRQMRYEGLKTWGVSNIVTSVPLLVQAALLLFLTGVLELLWALNTWVAIPLTIAVSAVVMFYTATTVLPATQFVFWYLSPGTDAAQCPYKSPQGWLVLQAITSVITHFDTGRSVGAAPDDMDSDDYATRFRRAMSWKDFDLAWTLLSDAAISARPQHAFQSLTWLKDAVDHPDLPIWTWHCLWNAAQSENKRTRHNILAVASGSHSFSSLKRMLQKPIDTPCFLFPHAISHLPASSSSWFVINTLCDIYTTSENFSESFNEMAREQLSSVLQKLQFVRRQDIPSDALYQRSLLCAVSIWGAGTYRSSFAAKRLLDQIYKCVLRFDTIREDRVAILRAICLVALRLSEAALLAKALDDAWVRLPDRPPVSLERYLLDQKIISFRLTHNFRRLAALAGSTPQNAVLHTDPAAPGPAFTPDVELHTGQAMTASEAGVIPALHEPDDIDAAAHVADDYAARASAKAANAVTQVQAITCNTPPNKLL